MSDGLCVTGTEPATGKSAIALGLYELLPRAPQPQPVEARVGVARAGVVAAGDRALSGIVARTPLADARGATVHDVVDTVAVTAVQARQGARAGGRS